MNSNQLARIAADPISRLRRLRGDDAPQESEARQAIQRVFKTHDGLVFLNWMIAQSYGKSIPESAGDSALRANEVRKRFLDQILSLAEDNAVSETPTPAKRGRRSKRPG